MKSKAAWTYGRLKIRALLPTGRGLWPALWMVSISTLDKDLIFLFNKISCLKITFMAKIIGQIMVKLI
jgi:hypothetical protein